MLDECKGEKFEELLAIFSTVVMYKSLQDEEQAKKSVSQKVATAPTLSKADQKSLLPLSIAHRASLTNLLEKKEKSRAKHRHLEHALHATEAELQNRVLLALERTGQIDGAEYAKGIAELTKDFDPSWENDPKWRRIVVNGNPIDIPTSLLDQPSLKGQRPITSVAVDDVVTPPQLSLSEDLDKRVKFHQANFKEWQTFGENLHASKEAQQDRGVKISLDGHQDLVTNANEATRTTSDKPSPRRGSVSEKVDEYEKLNKGMRESLCKAELSLGHWRGKPFTLTIRPHDDEEQSGDLIKGNLGETLEGSQPVEKSRNRLSKDPSFELDRGGSQDSTEGSATSRKGLETVEPDSTSAIAVSSEERPAVKEDASKVVAKMRARVALDDPSSPAEHQLSLVERTRKSMALTKAESGVGSSTTPSKDIPTLPINFTDSMPPPNFKFTGRETLLERTRQSMSLLPVKSQASRKTLKKPSKAYPINPFDTPKETHSKKPEFSTPPEELFSQDAKYDSVFKSRPKIALSPTQSPSFGCVEKAHESTGELIKENEREDETASSSPLAMAKGKKRLYGGKFVAS